MHFDAAVRGVRGPCAAVRKSNTPIDPKESQAFTLKGDLWRILTEANDCDFHLEPSAAGPTADRVIVEIPQDSSFMATLAQ